MDKLNENGSARDIFKSAISKPDRIPSRLYRNALGMIGQIVRSPIDRRRIFEYFAENTSKLEKKKKEVAIKLGYSQLFVFNVKRQVQKILKKVRKLCPV